MICTGVGDVPGVQGDGERGVSRVPGAGRGGGRGGSGRRGAGNAPDPIHPLSQGRGIADARRGSLGGIITALTRKIWGRNDDTFLQTNRCARCRGVGRAPCAQCGGLGMRYMGKK